MLMEKGEMDLEKHLHLNRKMEYDKIRHLWIQMLCAVNSIHKQGIIHTDLKPANFLFVDSSLKLIDFGIAKGLQVRGFDTKTIILIIIMIIITKYEDLRIEIARLWNKEVSVIPIVVGALGTLTANLKKNSKELGIPNVIPCLQKSALLGTASILRRALGISSSG